MFCGWPTTEYRNVKNWVLKKGKSPDIFKCIQRHSSETKGGKLVFERQPSQNFSFNWVLRARKGCQSSALDTKSNRRENWEGHYSEELGRAWSGPLLDLLNGAYFKLDGCTCPGEDRWHSNRQHSSLSRHSWHTSFYSQERKKYITAP